ncbi:MAG: hypothetical protein HY997_18840 [Mycolicibacterium neoaurum]|nr:hypothetical protein [Mycolicibacterium neoaurum]
MQGHSSRRRVAALLAIVFLATTAICLLVARVHPRWALEGTVGFLSSLGPLEDTTYYAVGYSDRAFLKIKPGISCAEVEALLGPPLEVRELKGDQLWLYSSRREDTSYHERVVVVRDCIAIRRLSSYYVD